LTSINLPSHHGTDDRAILISRTNGPLVFGGKFPLVRHGRSWLTLGYVLATMLAQGLHDHGDPGHRESPAGPGCNEPRTHVESHPEPLAAPHLDDCLACQYRAQSHWIELAAPRIGPTLVAATPEPPRDQAAPAPTLRRSGRAPPRV